MRIWFSSATICELDEDEREGKVPYVWALDAKRELSRLLVDEPMVKSAEERRDFWIMLRAWPAPRKPRHKR